jgi:hypothetical protein
MLHLSRSRWTAQDSFNLRVDLDRSADQFKSLALLADRVVRVPGRHGRFHIRRELGIPGFGGSWRLMTAAATGSSPAPAQHQLRLLLTAREPAWHAPSRRLQGGGVRRPGAGGRAGPLRKEWSVTRCTKKTWGHGGEEIRQHENYNGFCLFVHLDANIHGNGCFFFLSLKKKHRILVPFHYARFLEPKISSISISTDPVIKWLNR